MADRVRLADLPMPIHTLRVVVFGHYDSRGGTTAIAVPDFNAPTIERAVDQYAALFTMDDTPEMWSEYRELARSEMLFCADLHATETLRPDCDLEDDEGLTVLIDETTVPAVEATDSDDVTAITREQPVQLEAVRLPDDDRERTRDQDFDDDADFWRPFARALTNPTHRRWNDDAYSFILEPLRDPHSAPNVERAVDG